MILFIDKQYEENEKILQEDKSFKDILNKYSLDFVTIKLLEKDSDFLEKVQKDYSLNCANYFDSYIKEIEERYDEDVDTILAEKRYGKIKGIIAETLKTSLNQDLILLKKLIKILLNRILGGFPFS